MDDVFLKLVNLSISASWLILAVLVLRFVLKKAPKWVMPLLWGVVALRLVCLFSIESALSLIPSAETIPSEIVTETREPVLYEQATLDIVTNPTLPSAAEVPVGVSRQQAQVDFNIYSVLWLAGMAALLVHALVSAGKLKRKLATAILLRDNIYESEFVDSPFVFGVVKPNIYLPMHMDEGTAAHVIAHERAHLARRDHWWKVLGYLVLALHWFNPLVWVAYILFCRDIELACDEKVVKGLDGAARADYSQALLSCAAPKRAVAACPLAFGEGNIKTRVKSALHYKKPAFWVAAAAVLAVVIVAVCFLTNPRSDIDAETLLGTSRGEITRISVKMGEASSGEEYRMSTEEIKTVLSLLDAAEYERLGSASAMQECYARLYFESAAGERELMLSQGEVLANPIKGNQKAQLYGLRSGGTVLKNYVKWCVDRNDPTVPEDIAQQVERLICGMPLGNYLFGELVYDDPAWETSFSDNFSSTWPELRICCDSAFADFSVYTQMSAYVKDSGYYYRVSEWEEIDLTETEYKILRLLMQSPQRIFPVQVIYETVWGEPYFYVSNGTVMVHIRNLRMKVEHNPQNPQRICTVWGKGYRFAAQDISVRFVKENGKAGLAFENAVLPGQHRTDSTKVGLTSIETMMEKMHAACRIEQSGERFCITLLFPIEK